MGYDKIFLGKLTQRGNGFEFVKYFYFDISRNIVEIDSLLADTKAMSDLDKTAARLEALGNPTRLEIFRMLVRTGETGLAVGVIQRQLDIPASTLSHHLKHLELVALVSRRREGTSHFCSANYPSMDSVIRFLSEHCCADTLQHNSLHLAHKIKG